MRSMLLVLALVSVTAHAQNIAACLADLSAVRNDLPRLHPGFFAVTPRVEFDAAAAALAHESTTLSNPEFYVRLLSLAAMARDAHTSISLGGIPAELGFARLPLGFRWFDDGLYVSGTDDANVELMAARVLAIQGEPAEEVLARLRPVVAHENESWFRHLATDFVANLGVLRGIGLVPESEAPEFRFRLATGEVRSVTLTPNGQPVRGQFTRTPGFATVTARRNNENYWAEYWPEAHTVYVAYRVCQESPARPIATFTREIIGLAQSGPMDTMIFDLRGNTGGNSIYFDRLLEGLNLPRYFLQNRQFRVFGLIDRGTFSSGMFAAMSLKAPLRLPNGSGPADGSAPITLVGEATGGKPASYGEVRPFTLPGSGLRGQHSTRFFATRSHIPNLPSVEPEVPVSLRSTDHFARHDPFLAAVFARAQRGSAAPAGDVMVLNAASERPDAAIAPGSLVLASGEFGEAPVMVKVNGQQIVPHAQAGRELLLVLPGSLTPGPAVIEVEVGTGTLRGEFTVSRTGPGVFRVFENDPTQVGAVRRDGELLTLTATGLGPELPLAWVAQSPVEVLSLEPVATTPGMWRVQIKLPDGWNQTGPVPVFLADDGRASNGVSFMAP